MKRVIVIGAGGHGRSVAEILLTAAGCELVGFVDDAAERLGTVWDRPVLAPVARLAECRVHADAVVVAIGNNAVREAICARLPAIGFELLTVVHSRAIVSPRAVVGPGCAIMAGAVVGTEARLGTAVIVNSGAVVDHHCTIEDFGHIGTNASMAGGSLLGRAAWMQAGSSLGYGVRVAAGAVLAPGEGRAER